MNATSSSGSAANESARTVVIKKYANRRLYNTETSAYVTLEDLCQLIIDGNDFVVYDAKSGEDLTRSVLTQIIVEQEARGQNLLPVSFLKRVIGLYGDNVRELVPHYLEASMEHFARQQEAMRDVMSNAMQGVFPINQLQEMGRQNMMMFQSAMQDAMQRTMGMFGGMDAFGVKKPEDKR